jgi:hypothetical protein
VQPSQTEAVPARLLLPSCASLAFLPLPLSAWPGAPTGLLWKSLQRPCLHRNSVNHSRHASAAAAGCSRRVTLAGVGIQVMLLLVDEFGCRCRLIKTLCTVFLHLLSYHLAGALQCCG